MTTSDGIAFELRKHKRFELPKLFESRKTKLSPGENSPKCRAAYEPLFAKLENKQQLNEGILSSLWAKRLVEIDNSEMVH